MPKKLLSLVQCFYAILFLGMMAAVMCFLFSQSGGDSSISHFTNTADPYVDLLIIFGVFKLHGKMPQPMRFLFKILGISCIFLFFCDISFYLAVYIGSISKISAINILAIPFVLWTTSLISFYLIMIRKRIILSKAFFWLLGACILKDALIVGLYMSSPDWTLKLLSFQGGYETLSGFLVLYLFDLIILCLIYADSPSIQCFLTGNIVILAGDAWIKYAYVTRKMHMLPIGDLFWLLGLILTCFSFYLIFIEKAFDMEKWFRPVSSIKTHVVLWTFGITILSFIIFLILGAAFSTINSQIFIGLPFFFMMYATIVVIIAIFIGRTFEAPFKKIEANIRALMFDDDKQNMNAQFATVEFRFLQKFLLEAYEYKEAKDRTQKQLGALTSKVAHDIKSPTAALMVLTEECSDIREEDRIALRHIANTISDIANNILHQYPIVGDERTALPHKHEALLISTLIREVISAKRLQYKARGIEFEDMFSKESYFAFIEGDQTEFKRMLSNLINNAVEACSQGSPKIRISLELRENQVILGVEDNGQGMPSELIERIMKEEPVTAGKSDGHGIGLGQVRQTLAEYQGKMKIQSAMGKGTLINLIFKQSPTPAWIADQIVIAPGASVLILDDDPSIHTAWDHRLRDASEKGGLKIQHFREGRETMRYVDALSLEEKENLFLLTDYELLKQDVNGLDVLEHTGIKRSILVTSHYTNPKVLERAALLGTKILPKLLVVEIPINLKVEAEKTIQMVDLIIVDDKLDFIKIIADYALKDKKVAMYDSPYQFLQEYHAFPKETLIFLDDDFGVVGINGRKLAEKLHQEGYHRLYLISGTNFKDLPEYLIQISRFDIGDIINHPL